MKNERNMKNNTDIKHQEPTMAHNLDLVAGASSLARIQNYIGQYVCVHSAPSAWYGIMVDASIDGGVISCDLADAGLWTSGTTKDLVRPGSMVTEDLQARRDGVVTVTAVTALQPAGFFSERDDRLRDAPVLRTTRPRPPRETGLGIEDFATFMGQDAQTCASAVLKVYQDVPDRKKKVSGNDGDIPRGNFSGVIQLVREYAEAKQFPLRGVAAIVLDGARKYFW